MLKYNQACSQATSLARELIIDRVLADPDYSHVERRRVPADCAVVYPHARHAEFPRSTLTDIAYRIRGLPTFPRSIDGMLDFGFTLIDEAPPHEYLIGLAGQFWKPGAVTLPLSAQAFSGFCQPGYAIVVMNVHLQPLDAGATLLSTESRVKSWGTQARLAMAIYWRLIYPFSRLIRREMLTAISEAALHDNQR